MKLPPGWLTESEAECLAELATAKLVLEIGSYLGRSTVCMARTATSVISVDHHRGSEEHQPGQDCHNSHLVDPFDTSRIDTAGEFLRQLSRHGMRDRVLPIIGDIRKVAQILRPAQFDLVFIDGAHDDEATRFDVTTALTLVKPTGMVVAHDTSPQLIRNMLAGAAIEAGIDGTLVEVAFQTGRKIQSLEGSLAALL